MLDILQGEAYQSAVDRLPGYQAVDCGRVMSLPEAFASLRPVPPAKQRGARSAA
jgi:hypothetical protein